MKNLVQDFTQHLKKGIALGQTVQAKQADKIHNVLITGLGGSGIGGTIASQLISDECPVPVEVNKNYFIPAYVNKNTLVIVSSYSGNTEETIQAMKFSAEQNAQLFCISSGGEIIELAKKQGYGYIQLPAGFPPRAALGFSLVQLFYVFKAFGLIKLNIEASFHKAIELIEKKQNNIISDADKLAEKLNGKRIIIYTAAEHEGVAIRFRQQLNENSKVLCWHHVIPEMNHNELVGWTEQDETLAVVFLRSEMDYTRTKTRIEINKSIISKYTSNIFEIWAEGNEKLEQALYLIHFCDWISCFIAEKKKIDPVEVKVIDYLKSELSNT